MELRSAILIFGLLSFITFVVALRKSQVKSSILSRPYRVCEMYGSFVWADHVIFGPFWFAVSIITYLINDIVLFLLVYSAFWLVRSIGEMIYWFMQQFHPRVGNEPGKFWVHRHVPGEAVWFIHQIFWQCVTVVSLILTIYLAHLWLSHLS